MRRLGLAFCLAAMTALVWSAPRTATIIYEKGTGVYEIALLTLALQKTTRDFGPFELKPLNQDLSEDRAIALLLKGSFDITFMVLTPERERLLLPIRIDLTRGIQGYRLFLIRKDDASRFAAVSSLDELRTRFVAGFGAQWGDLGVLEANGLPVVTAPLSAQLYPMLQGRRFDYFPRGINEIWDNLAQHKAIAPDMVVEERLALYYPLVQCFVVAPGKDLLATRIRAGLERALADGSMKKLFMEFHQADIERANIPKRRLFRLSNPDLPTGGPSVDTSWWLH